VVYFSLKPKGCKHSQVKILDYSKVKIALLYSDTFHKLSVIFDEIITNNWCVPFGTQGVETEGMSKNKLRY
jgi:hypothetical protein